MKTFEKSVTVKDDIYSVFDIGGFRLGLFAFEKCRKNIVMGATAYQV